MHTIEGSDCSPFTGDEKEQRVIGAWVRHCEASDVMTFSERKDRDLSFAHYAAQEGRWWAGRLVGESFFRFEDCHYRIVIRPRFGEAFVFQLIESIFNLRLPHSAMQLSPQSEQAPLLKRIVAYLWLHQLAQANQHGLPRHQAQRLHQGYAIKGRLQVRPSVRPLLTSGQVVSSRVEKEPDALIFEILRQAYQVLRADYGLGALAMPDTAREAIRELGNSRQHRVIQPHEYHQIRYRPIYQGYKAVIDLSWDILKRQNPGQTLNTDKQKGLGFFIDMAELWELYLLNALQRHFSPQGWQVCSEKTKVYAQKGFARHMIPDIVMHRGNDVMIWDAKYKKMDFRPIDVDRADFYQIHSYLMYYRQYHHLLGGGLLYPLLQAMTPERQSTWQDHLFSQPADAARFVIDGVTMPVGSVNLFV